MYVSVLNEYIELILIINFLLFLLGFKIIIKNGGIANNFSFFIAILTFFIYYFVTPIYYFYSKHAKLYDIYIYDYYGLGFLFGSIGLLCFILGYLFVRAPQFDFYRKEIRFEKCTKNSNLLIVIFLVFFFLSLSDLIINGVDFVSVVLGNSSQLIKSKSTFGDLGDNNYLEAFTDSLITIVILAYFYKLPRVVFFIIFILAITLFLLMAFRFRIIFVLLGFLGVYVYKNGLPFRRLMRYLIVSGVLLYFMLFITVNRWVFATGNYSELQYDPSTFDPTMIFEQTRGFLPDLALYKYYIENDVPHDYSISMFGYILVRAIPKYFFPNEIKPYPPPSLQISIDMLGHDRNAKYYGEAITSFAHFYISFGLFGVILMSFFMGKLLRNLKRYFDANFGSDISLLVNIIIGIGVFQFISRGYFPQVFQNYVFLFLPLIVFYSFAKKQIFR